MPKEPSAFFSADPREYSAICAVPDCGRRTRSTGKNGGVCGRYCPAHAARIRTHGSPLADKPIERRRKYQDGRACLVEGCDLVARENDMCFGHSARVRRYGEAFPDVPFRFTGGARKSCAVEGCNRDSVASSGLCGAHHARLALSGDAADFEGYIREAAQGTIDSQGYRRVPVRGGGYAREHRLVMQYLLGRALLPGENVHHVNGDRADNTTDGPLRTMPDGKLRSGNLELWSTSQPKGQAVVDKVRWARQILAQYGELVPDDEDATDIPEKEGEAA